MVEWDECVLSWRMSHQLSSREPLLGIGGGIFRGEVGGIMGRGGRSNHYRPPFVSSLESSVGAADSVANVDYIIFK